VAARNRLERVGWQQYFSFDSGPNCMLGHLRQVGDPRCWYDGPAYFALRAAVGGMIVGDWNDAKGRTLEEVLAAFDKAIAATAPEPYVALEVPAEPVACPA
jgi:hypothetical protein